MILLKRKDASNQPAEHSSLISATSGTETSSASSRIRTASCSTSRKTAGLAPTAGGDIRPGSLEHLVGKGDQRRRHRDTDDLCRPQVDDEIEFDRRLHRQIGRLLTLEDAIDIGRCLSTEDTRTLFLSQLEGRDPEDLAVWQDGWRSIVHS